MTDRVEATGSRASIRWISGPVLRARTEGPFVLREAIRVGPARLLGEVIRVLEDEIVAQVYEDTTGLRPGVEVRGTGDLLGIRLGPGLLGSIYDLCDTLPEHEPGGQSGRSPSSRRSRKRTRDLATRTAPGVMSSSAATSAAARPATTTSQNARQVRS